MRAGISVTLVRFRFSLYSRREVVVMTCRSAPSTGSPSTVLLMYWSRVVSVRPPWSTCSTSV